jgi:glycosyltransferase involved in cell wall biosynthesis
VELQPSQPICATRSLLSTERQECWWQPSMTRNRPTATLRGCDSRLPKDDLSSYRAAADFLNSSNVDLVCLQHEYGIFGGNAGSYVLELLQHLTMPVVTTLHTVLREPDLDQRIVMQQIAARSDRLIVMSEYSSRVLEGCIWSSRRKDRPDSSWHPRLALCGAGCLQGFTLNRGKGCIAHVRLVVSQQGIRERDSSPAAHLVARHSNAVYVIAGATHPHVRAREGDRYREQLQALAKELGVEEEVIFHNRFVSPKEMASLVGSADIYITPYRHEAQAVSGTLAYAMGAGKAIISTPYWHAAELLDDGRGHWFPLRIQLLLQATAIELLDNDAKRQSMRSRAYLYARQMVWNRAAQSYMRSFTRARANRMQPVHSRLPVQAAGIGAASQLLSV